MTLLTIEGTYRNGQVELVEAPQNAPVEARVLVTFLPTEAAADAAGAVREAAVERLIRAMQSGADYGGGPYKREEL